MQKQILRKSTWSVTAICGGWMLCVALNAMHAQPAMAVVDQMGSKELSSKSGLVSDQVNRKLQHVHSLMKDQNFDAALEVLDSLKERTATRAAERAQVMQIYGYLYAQKEQFDLALESLQEAVATESLGVSMTLSAMRTIAQIYLAQEKHDQAALQMLEYFSYQKHPRPEDFMILASAYAQLKNFDNALSLVEQALAISEQVPEGWLQFHFAIQYELKKFDGALKTLDQLIALKPEHKPYWMQKVSTHMSQDDSQAAAITLDLMKKQNLLSEETDWRHLIQMMLHQEMPFQAARLMNFCIESNVLKAEEGNLKLLAQAWLQAQEMDRAIETLALAARASKNGDLYLQQAQLLTEQQRWQDAANAFEKAVAKGGLSKPGIAHLGLGIAGIQLKDFDKAQKQLQAALKYKNVKKAAGQWMKQMETLAALHQAG